MNTGREIRSYDYVNHPYDRVRDTLKQNARRSVPVRYKGCCFPRRVGRR